MCIVDSIKKHKYIVIIILIIVIIYLLSNKNEHLDTSGTEMVSNTPNTNTPNAFNPTENNIKGDM